MYGYFARTCNSHDKSIFYEHKIISRTAKQKLIVIDSSLNNITLLIRSLEFII